MFFMDFRVALRRLVRSDQRAFSIGALATIGVAVAALTLILQLANAVLWAPLPFADADAVVELSERNLGRQLPRYSVSTPNFQSWQLALSEHADLAATQFANPTLSRDGERPATRVIGFHGSHNLWRVLGIPLLAGRSFDAEHQKPGAAPVVILSKKLWQTRFANDPTVIGRTIGIDEVQYTVLGIAPNDVGFSDQVDLWLPLQETNNNRGDRRLTVWARLRAHVTLASMQSALTTVSTQLAAQFPQDNVGWDAIAQSARAAIVGVDVRARVWMLLIAVVIMLLLACANIANLQIARAFGQAADQAVRYSLGSSRWGLLRLPLVESLLLGAIGASIGLTVASISIGVVAANAPTSVPRLAAMRFDVGIGFYAFATTCLLMVLCGAIPAWLALRQSTSGSLRSARSTGALAPLRQGLVVVQFALATLLVSGAALLGNQMANLLRQDLGFVSSALLIARLSLPEVLDEAAHRRVLATYDELLAGARALPGVRSAAITNEVPMGQLNTSMEVVAGGDPSRLRDAVQASWRIVSSDYLKTLGANLLSGRDFQANDENPHSIMLSQALAQRLWPGGEDPIARQVTVGNGQTYTVTGIVADVRQLRLAEPPTPTMYFPTTWYVWPTMTLTLRSAGDPLALVAPLQSLATRLLPNNPLFEVQALQSLIDADTAEPRQQLAIVTLFALASLLLAGIGIAATIVYSIRQRHRELAVRMAVGARVARLQADLIGSGAKLSLIGLGAGTLAALFAFKLLGSQVALASNPGPWLFPGVLLAFVVALIASAIAARGLARIPATAALRGD